MKELEINPKKNIELSVQQKKQVEHQLIGEIVPHQGHQIWQINIETLEVTLAKYSNATATFGMEVKKEIIKKVGFNYVSALNKKNALKKHLAGVNGSKPLSKEPLKFENFN